MRVCLMTMVLLTPVPSNAGPDLAQVQLGMAYERLSNGYEPWRSITLDVRAGGSRGVIHAAVDESTRFSQVDHNITAGFERRLASRWTIGGDVQASPSPHFSPTWGTRAGIEFASGTGWGVQGSNRRLHYLANDVTVSAATLERYVSRYRIAYSIADARLDGAGAISQRVNGDLYYGPSSVGVLVAFGDEVESLIPDGVLRTHVRAVGVMGHQAVRPRWLLVYDAVIHRQGSFYTRRRFSAGVQHRF